MNIDLKDRVVIVTGAGRGIGKEIALMASAAGADLVLAARSKGQLQEVAEKIESNNRNALVVAIDLCDDAAVDELVKRTLDRYKRIDVIVNNAGANSIANLVMAKEQDFRAVYELNLFAAFRLSKAALRHMIPAKRGRIINISSVSAKYGSSYNSAYASSKAALLGLTRSVARETAQLGITANAICPWHVDTELVHEAMGRRARMFGKSAEDYLADIVAESPMKRLVEAREVASLAIYLMSDQAAAITGQSLNVCGGVMMQ